MVGVLAGVLLVLLAADDLGDLAAKLRDPSAATRQAAAAALAKQGAAAAAVEPELLASLRDTDGDVRLAAALALERIRLRSGAPSASTLGAEAKRVVASVDSVWARLAADGGGVGDEDVARLVDAYHGASDLYGRALLAQDERAFVVAARVLVERLGIAARVRHRRRAGQTPLAGAADGSDVPAVAAWKAALPEDRFARVEEVAGLGDGAFPVLSDALARDAVELHATAAFALYVADSTRVGILDWLQGMLLSERDIARLEAAHALGRVGVPAASAVPGLMLALESRDEKLRAEAAWALGQMGPAARSSARLVGTLLRDPSLKVATNSVAALRAMGPGAAGAVSDLIRCAKDDARGLAPDAAASLGAIGTLSGTVVPALTDFLDSEYFGAVVQDAAILALTAIGPDAAPAAPRLLRLADVSPDDETEGLAEAALLAIGEAAVPAICDGLKVLGPRASGHLQDAAFHILERMGPAAKSAIPRLAALVLDNGSYIGHDAARVLGKIGRGDPKAASALTRGVERGNLAVMENAARALGEIGPVAKGATPPLAVLLRHERWSIRLAAAQGLAGIGPDARNALPALEKAASEDKVAQVRSAAQKAIEAIRK